MDLSGDPQLTWQRFGGKRVRVYAPRASYAPARALDVLREAEQAIELLTEILEPAEKYRKDEVSIYLVDAPSKFVGVGLSLSQNGDGTDSLAKGMGQAQSTSSSIVDGVIVQFVEHQTPREPVAWPLARLLVIRWFGVAAGQADLLIDGVAGVVAGRTGADCSIQEADDRVRAELAAGRPVSIFAQSAHAPPEAPSNGTGIPKDPATTSFVAFLIQTFGTSPLREFLTAYDANRRDQAALFAYHQPLAVLEEMWLARLKRQPSSGGAVRSFVRCVAPLLKPYRWRALEILVYMLLGLSYNLALPLSSKYLVDTVIPSRSLHTLLVFIFVLLLIYILSVVIGLRRGYVTNWINQHLVAKLQEQLFSHLQWLSHDFYTRSKVGDIMSRMSNDLQTVEYAVAEVTGYAVFLALGAVAAAITMIVLSPLLATVVLVIMPLFSAGYVLLRSRLEQASRERQDRAGEVMAVLEESLSAYSVVRAFGIENRLIAFYNARLATLLRATLRQMVIGSLFEATLGMAWAIGQIVVLGVGAYLVITDRVTVGTVLAFLGLIPSLLSPVSALSGLGQRLYLASGAMERLRELLEEPVTVADKPGAASLPPLSREIRLEQVTFGYSINRPILRGLDLTIPAGSSVAIVGRSGAGKSSIASLLLRFWDPDEGRVLFDSHDLRGVTCASLRSQIGAVFQETFIFDSTIRENILIGRPDASDAQVEAAARAAKLDEYIRSLPGGYDTVVGERGVRMSGGQRQRLAIARALLRNPRVLILDEATSALDAQTESEILDTLNAVTRGRTTVNITHRLTSVLTADRIFVLDDGQLVEQGTHAELVQAGGIYHRLYEEQTGYVSGRRVLHIGVEVAHLRMIPLFAVLDAAELSTVADQLALERYAVGEEIVRQGEPGDKLYFISRGQVEVSTSDGPNEQRVGVLGVGNYFGEVPLLSGEPSTTTVRAITPTQLFSLAQSDLLALLNRKPTLRQAVSDTARARRALPAGSAPTATPVSEGSEADELAN